MKRFRPRAKGRAAPILKPYSSVTIILSESKKWRVMGQKVNPVGFRLGVNEVGTLYGTQRKKILETT